MIQNANLIEYIESLLMTHFPSIENLRKSHRWLLKQIDQGVGPFPLRHFQNSPFYPTLSVYPKVNFFQDPSLPFSIIASDNEANSSFYALVRESWTDQIDQLTMLQMMQKQLICVGIFTRQRTTSFSHDHFRKLGISGAMNNHPCRVALLGLKLYHISDAGRLTDIRSDKVKSVTDEIKVRIYRLLSPLNVIPYPNVVRGPWREFIDNRKHASEIGETPEGKYLFAAILWRHLQTQGAEGLFKEWMEHSGVNYRIEDLKTILAKHRDTKVTISALEPTQRGQTIIQPIQTPSNESVNSPSEATIFEIRYNRNGRCHLDGFGITTGGPNRDKPFIFRVINQAGMIEAESEVHTAETLRIAEDGRENYDTDTFRQTDFFKNSRPHTALARRVNWKW